MEPTYAMKLLLFTGLGLSLSLSSCGKDDDPTPEPVPPVPTQGALQITTDWADRSEDAPIPDTYLFRLNDTLRTVKDKVFTYPSALNPGRYSLLAYNEAEHITVSGNTATIELKEDGTLQPHPGYLFSASSEAGITAGDTLRTVLKMEQRIHRLTLKVALADGDGERILATDALLTGIVPAIGLVTGKPAAPEGKSVKPQFSLIREDGSRAAARAYLVATLHLFDVMAGERQRFTLHLTLKEGHPQDIGTDLTEDLEGFGDTEEPFQLEAELSLPVGAAASATITDWTRSDEYIEIEDKEE